MSMIDLAYVIHNLKENDKRELLECYSEDDYLGRVYLDFRASENNEAYTAYRKDIAICVFGIKAIQPHIGHVWAFSTEECQKVGLTVIKTLKEMIKTSNYARITTTSPVYRPESHQAIKLIGMHEEGRLERLGKSGADFISFVNGKSDV